MNVNEIIDKLKTLGDERAIAIWKRLGNEGDNYFGVGLTKLKGLAKEIKKNHELALKLWETGIHDAKLLATYIEEPKKVDESQIDEWIADVPEWDLNMKLSENVIAKTSFAESKIKNWTQDNVEHVKRAGFHLVYELARRDKKLPDDFFEKFLPQIEKELQNESNWTKEAMNNALFAIGSRSKNLQTKALKVAKKIGKVEVDYGVTTCKTLDCVEKLSSDRLRFKLN